MYKNYFTKPCKRRIIKPAESSIVVSAFAVIARDRVDCNRNGENRMATTKLYVGRLPYSTTDAELSEMFAAHGTVESARVITDRDSGRSKGFGFVEMSSEEEANAAIAALNDTDQGKMKIVVNIARPKEA